MGPLFSVLILDSSFDNLDFEYDRVYNARDQPRLLGQMADSKIVALATYASQRLECEIQEGYREVEETLKVSRTVTRLTVVHRSSKRGSRLSDDPRCRFFAREQGAVSQLHVNGMGRQGD